MEVIRQDVERNRSRAVEEAHKAARMLKTEAGRACRPLPSPIATCMQPGLPIRPCKKPVRAKTGVDLEPEVQVIGERA